MYVPASRDENILLMGGGLRAAISKRSRDSPRTFSEIQRIQTPAAPVVALPKKRR